MSIISVVVPCYNEEDSLAPFFMELSTVIESMRSVHTHLQFEIILVDDGSTDNTFAKMKSIAKQYSSGAVTVLYVSFSRNFGKEAALYAGLQHATGDYVATMDADLQDPPALLPQMYEYVLSEDYDNAATKRITRKGEPPVRSYFARMFYRIINRLSDIEIVDGARDYRLMSRQMVDSILTLAEYNRFSKGLFSWVGYKTMWMEYDNLDRVAGETKWSFWSLFKYSIEGIAAFSTAPLHIASVSGVIFCFLAVAAIIFVAIRAIIFGDPVAGWPSLICLILFIGGIQLLCLGVMGEYLAKAYLETKHRPLYIIKDSNSHRGLQK